MAIRESLNKNPRVTTGIALVLVVLAVGTLVWQFTSAGATSPDAPIYATYSADDGKSYFYEDGAKYAPFDHDGKEAVRAYVFSCDERKTAFVGYLERFTPEALSKLRAVPADDIVAIQKAYDEVFPSQAEVKRPGESAWVKRESPEGMSIVNVKCPEGATGKIERID